MSRRPAFTLVEILIAAAIFVVLLTITLSVFTNVSKIQSDRKNSFSLTSQAKEVQKQFEDAVARTQPMTSMALPTVGFFGPASGPSQNIGLMVRTFATSSDQLSTTLEWDLYCTKTNANGVRRPVRVRIGFDNQTTPPRLTQTVGDCEGASQTSFFTLGAPGQILTQLGTDYLMNDSIGVTQSVYGSVYPTVTSSTYLNTDAVAAIRYEFSIQDVEATGSNASLSLRGTALRTWSYDQIKP